MLVQIHNLTINDVMDLMTQIRNEYPDSPIFGEFVRGLSRAVEERKIEEYEHGTVIRIENLTRESVREIEAVIARSKQAHRVFVVSTIPINGDTTIIISAPVTQGTALSAQETAKIARLAGEAHNWEEAVQIAPSLEPYWPIMGGRSTPFIRVTITDDIKLPEFYDVVRAAVAMRFVGNYPAITLHLAGQSNAAATFVLRALDAAGQKELARILGEAFGGRVLVDNKVISQYGQYMPSLVVQSAELTARLRKQARLAFFAINLLYAQIQIGDVDLPSPSPADDRQLKDSVRLLRQFCSLHTKPEFDLDAAGRFSIQEVVDAAMLVLGHYLYFCQTYRCPPFPLAAFRSQIPTPPSMFTAVWKLMSSNDQMSLIKAARARGIEEIPVIKEVKMSQIAMASSSQDVEIQTAALREALKHLEVILVVDISGSMQTAIDIARGLAERFRTASSGNIKTIVFGNGKVGVYGNLPESLIPYGNTPGDPAVLECARWAQNIIASGKPGVCAILITDCWFNAENAEVVYGQGAYLQSGTVKRLTASPDNFTRVQGLHFVVVRIGKESIPASVSLLGEDVQIVQVMENDISQAVTDTIKALLGVSNDIRRQQITWEISGQRFDIEYARRQYNAIRKGEFPEPEITVEIKVSEKE